MKKVLFLLPDIWSMGRGQGMKSIHNFLSMADKKFDATILTTDIHVLPGDYPHSCIHQVRRPRISLNNRWAQYVIDRLINIYISVRYVFKALRLRNTPDVIYCASSVPVLACQFLAYIFNAQKVHRIYGTFLYENLGSLTDQIKKFEEVLLFKCKADQYIITNDGTRGDQVAKFYGIPERKITFLTNGVDSINVDAASCNFYEDLGFVKDDIILLCVSRMSSWKRVDRIVKAVNGITNPKVKLVVIGDGPQKEEWQEVATNPNIKFIGSVSAKKVSLAMRDADLFISMYDYSNVGNPLLEALQNGLPVIVYGSGGTEDIITSGYNGIVIAPTKDEDKLSATLRDEITSLITSPELRKKLAKNALDYSRSTLMTWEQRIESEIKIIEQLSKN